MYGQIGRGVSADGKEACVSNGKLAGKAVNEIEAYHQDDVDAA